MQPPDDARRRTAPFTLPKGMNFNDLAVDLLLYANSAGRAAVAGEVMQARGGWSGGIHASIEELQRAAEIAGAVYWLFRDLAEHEGEVRQFLRALALRHEAEQGRKRGQKHAAA